MFMKPTPTPFLGRYSIHREFSNKVGRQTFLAQDIHSQELVVIKVIQFGQAFQWADLKLFEREAKILKNLDHAAIPKYKDSFEVEIDGVHSFVLVQTYLEADSLETIIRSGRRFSEAEVKEIAERMLEILDYLHQQMPPVVHRDLKPSNILLTNRSGHSVGDIYLVDFGSVQTALSKESDTITIVGSYGYIPLEQFTGQATSASDLYSLGMTLIYLMTGVHPADIPQVNGKIQLPCQSIRPNLSRWLERMTEPYLNQRFESAALALAALNSDDGSYGYYHHLKPEGSKVEIYRDRNHLKIITERLKPYPLQGLVGLFPTGMFGWGLSSFTGSSTIIIVLVSGLILRVIYDCLIQWTPFKYWTHYRDVLIIDKNVGIQAGSCSRNPKNVRTKGSLSKFEHISLLVYNPGYTFDHYYQGAGQKKILNENVQMPPKLSLSVGNLEYPIGHKHLSKSELWWIGQEVSDFISLKMQTIYPIPEVPEESACGC
jgi:hypothetical protein